ncbi:hypothetical protein [Cupriavidus sp. TMH.W2]|uniref:hypothetical protein n=1 Tax=Cupriavidus sp. TMH.W2 TaxID=3434465 RepID=UPI003D7758E1
MFQSTPHRHTFSRRIEPVMTAALTLHPLKRQGNRYCGPTAISLLAGIATGDAARLIRAGARGEIRAVRGASAHDVCRVLATLGLASTEEAVAGRPTLRRWMGEHSHAAGTYLVNITDHWVVVHGRDGVACSRTDGALVAGDAHPNARSFVKHAYRITRHKTVDVAAVLAAARRATGLRPETSSERRRARALAQRHGIKIEREAGMSSYGVWPPAALQGERDPYAESGHYCGDWSEILDHVNGYVQALAALAGVAPKEH